MSDIEEQSELNGQRRSFQFIVHKGPIQCTHSILNYIVSGKGAIIFLPLTLTLPNADRFSIVFHRQT